MHTFSAGNDVLFSFNSDLSGDVTISVLQADGRNRRVASVPGRALLQFAAHVIVSRRISDLESQSPGEVLGFDLP